MPSEPIDLVMTNRDRQDAARDIIEVELPAAEPAGELERIGVLSPRYSRCRAVKLDPSHLEANRCVAFRGDGEAAEEYRLIRTQILQRTGGKGATVMITSALPGEGKTVTAINLALSFAREFNQTALLVDADLRQQSVHKVLGFPSSRGLSDYFLKGCPFEDLMVWPGIERLTVISGGEGYAGSSELLGSPGMKAVISEMKNRYPERFVFFDAPPLLTSADPLALSSLVDYVIVVVRGGQTPGPSVQRAVQMLPREKVLGTVLNGRRS